MIKKDLIIFAIPFLAISACRDEFMPEMDKYENLLVVDGIIANEPGPYTIKLSRTSNDNKPDYNPLPGCNVNLHEEAGSLEVLKEVDPGVYRTDSGGIRGQVGKSYKLEINTPDDEHYESEFFYSKCVANPDLMALAYTPPEEFPVYLTNTDEGIAFASDFCFDCTLWGGVLEKPDFWVDE